MNSIRYRIEDVDMLRNEVFRDYLKMTLKPGWQTSFYEKAKNSIGRHPHADKYRPIFDCIRNCGVENYSVDDMDMTAMIQLVLYSGFDPFQFSPEYKVQTYFKKFKDDRNIKGHLTGKEEADELFAHCVLAIKNIKGFAAAVDEYEQNIPEEDRSAFRTRSIKKADALRKELFKDLGRYAQIRMEADEYIEKFRKAGPDEKSKLYVEISEHYFFRYSKSDPERLTEFYYYLADAEIAEYFRWAFSNLVLYDDYDRADYILNKWFNCLEQDPKADFTEIIEALEWVISTKNEKNGLRVTPLMEELFEILVSRSRGSGSESKDKKATGKGARKIIIVKKDTK